MSILVSSAVLAGALSATVPTASAADKNDRASDKLAAKAAQRDSDGDGDIDRPDAVSAQVTAQLLDKRVENLGARTESTRTFANPEGTWTVEDSGATVRVQRDDTWVPVDYDLQQAPDGSWAPKASDIDIKVTDGGGREAARVTTEDGASLAFTWPTVLPEPTVEGGVATYSLSAATDLVVAVTADGVAARIQLNQEPAADDPVFSLGLRADNLELEQKSSTGALEIADEDGRTVGGTTQLLAWDAATDRAGDPTNVVELDANLEQKSASGDVTHHTLDLTAPDGFLSDPATVYPVTIDPDIRMTRVRDTWVRSGQATNYASDYRLIVGKVDPETSSNTNPARAYLKFFDDRVDTNPNAKVTSATLSLWQYYGFNCTNRRMYAMAAVSAWGDNLVWGSSMPGGTGAAAFVDANRGASGCGQGWTKLNLTNMVQAWNSGAIDNNGLRLHAADETASAFERRFCSMNAISSQSICNTTLRSPTMDVTYNQYPWQPIITGVSPSTNASGTFLSTSRRPKIAVRVSDRDGGSVKSLVQVFSGSTLKWEGYGPSVASGGTSTVTIGADLPDGSYTVKAQAYDSALHSPVSTPITMRVDATAPAVPNIVCKGLTSGTWYPQAPAASTDCQATSSNEASKFEWKRNNRVQSPVTATSGTAALGSYKVPADGVLTFSVQARDAAGNLSAPRAFGVGVGKGGILTPVDVEKTSSSVLVDASGPGSAESARIEYQPTGSDPSAPWKPATKLKKGSSTWTGATTDDGISSVSDVVWNLAEEGIKAPATVDMRVVFKYAGIERGTPARTITLVPNAFGGSFPTDQAGPGQVALMTGELQLDVSDVAIPVFDGTLSISRSHRSLSGPGSPATEVFGDGWIASLDGPEEGQAAMEVVDNTATEASIVLHSPDGAAYTYIHQESKASAQRPGVYVGDVEAANDNDILELTGAGADARLTLREEDGATTTWKHTGGGKWVVAQVDPAGDSGATRYSYDAAGRVIAIWAAAPAGVTCTPSTQTEGCRALTLNYGPSGTKTVLTSVDYTMWTDAADPVVKTVAAYEYDDGRLTASWDPRADDIDTGASLKSTYEYKTVAKNKTALAKLTEPGRTPWVFDYDTEGRLKTTARVLPESDGQATWTVDYDVALSGDGVPDLTSDAVATWGQTKAPVKGAAVFGPEAAGHTSDFTYASLSYWDTEGRTTNTARYGAGDWQVDSSAYDEQGNVVWQLDGGNRAAALASEGASEAVASSLATITIYNADGTRVESTMGPTHEVVLTGDVRTGERVSVRPVTETVYDDEAAKAEVPTPGRPDVSADAPTLNVPVEERSMVMDGDGKTYDMTRTRYRYDAVKSGDGDGWELKTPTRVSEQLGENSWSTTLTRFDAEGKPLETRTPQGVAGIDESADDTRSRTTVYYTGGPNNDASVCGGEPQWAGLECLIGPAGQPTSGSVPRTRITSYDMWQNVTGTVETSGHMTRRFTTVYDAAGRKKSASTTMEGAPAGDMPVADVNYAYSATTGDLVAVASDGKIQTTEYDDWGRVTSYSDGAGNTTTTTYDAAGRTKTVDDGKGTYTYTYDGTDAAGKTERRGLVTKVDVGLASGPDEFAVAYDAHGRAHRTVYPNGVTATTVTDSAGHDRSLTYETADGEPVAGFTQEYNSAGLVYSAASNESQQTYTYDKRDRLTRVDDLVAGVCTRRDYELSLDSNRTALSTSTASSGCTSSNAVVDTSTFDDADRLTDAGYTYDAFGRTRTVPASDLAGAEGNGDLSVRYHSNDMVASLSQTVAGQEWSKTYALDGNDRITKTSDVADGVPLGYTDNHYVDSTRDWPAWTSDRSRPNEATAWTETWTRYVEGPAGGLALSQDSDGTSAIQVANMHGDIVAELDNGGSTVTMTSWSEQTEYGLERTGSPAVGRNYGWLGTKQRSTDTVGGLTLMGVRLYNPATGRFLSMDPVYGGNDNTYTYPTDPVNATDISGTRQDQGRDDSCRVTKKNKKWKKVRSYWNTSKWSRARRNGSALEEIIWRTMEHMLDDLTKGVFTMTEVRYRTRQKYEHQCRCKSGRWEYRTVKRGRQQFKGRVFFTAVRYLDSDVTFGWIPIPW